MSQSYRLSGARSRPERADPWLFARLASSKLEGAAWLLPSGGPPAPAPALLETAAA